MKWLMFLTVIIFSCNDSGQDSDRAGDSASTTVDTATLKDFHTRYSDVVENLFVYLDHKNWSEAGTFYTDSTNVKYFQNLFPGGPDKIELLSIKSLEKDFEVKGFASKQSDTIQLCLRMQIANNKITSQKTCN